MSLALSRRGLRVITTRSAVQTTLNKLHDAILTERASGETELVKEKIEEEREGGERRDDKDVANARNIIVQREAR